MTFMVNSFALFPAATNDPYFANVSALLHMDGADTSTTFADETGRTWTAYGNAQIDTAQSMYGGASGLFDGTGDFITTASSADFAYGTGDFTWELWFRSAAWGSNNYLLDHGANGGTITYVGGKLHYYNTTTGLGSSLYTTGFGSSLNTGQWYHIAAVRISGTTYLYIDGVLSTSASDTHNYAAQALNVARHGGGGYEFNGHMDEMRITKGVGRYASGFTPSGPFPDS